ncbi:hypothetical protein [Pseudonocardia sp. ICBG162]|uniref:hypothetical protein n=1 Tax=Pseudonocardia sp. ICBG162 TaxID=2846761 RepID=UPI001CF6606E|nr:hypothetical protein [Pseudonocardia sp. ICBG162]
MPWWIADDGGTLHCAAVDQLLAVLSRGGATAAELRAVVAVALEPSGDRAPGPVGGGR